MAKLTEDAIALIQEFAEKTPYGKITVNLNETSDQVDIVLETRARMPAKPKAGRVLMPQVRREG